MTIMGRAKLYPIGSDRRAWPVRLPHSRKALGLSQPAIARVRLIASDRTIRRWEQNEQAISGPAWVALEMMLRGKGEAALADRVTSVIEQRRIGGVSSG
jgi:hypothetical protein